MIPLPVFFILAAVLALALVPILYLCFRRRARRSHESFSPSLPRPLALYACFGVLRPLKANQEAIDVDSDGVSARSDEKSAVRRELSAVSDNTTTSPSIKSTSTALYMLAAVPGHVLAMIYSPVALRSRSQAPSLPTSLSLPTLVVQMSSTTLFDSELASPHSYHARRNDIWLLQSPLHSSPKEPMSPSSVYSQPTLPCDEDGSGGVPSIIVSEPSCPTLAISIVPMIDHGMLSPSASYH